jgi:hypothetical protein
MSHKLFLLLETLFIMVCGSKKSCLIARLDLIRYVLISYFFISHFKAYKSLDYCPNKIHTEALFEKSRLAEGTYIINSVEQDSLKRWQINSYIQFEGSYSYDKNLQIKKFDLYDPKYKNLPWFYATYYIILGLLWTAVFYHLYQYLHSIKKSQTFEKANLNHRQWLLSLRWFVQSIEHLEYLCRQNDL